MTLNNCPNCRSPAAIRYQKSGSGIFHVWAQCETCGRRTRDFLDYQEPTPDSTGGRFAALAWNSGDSIQEGRI